MFEKLQCEIVKCLIRELLRTISCILQEFDSLTFSFSCREQQMVADSREPHTHTCTNTTIQTCTIHFIYTQSDPQGNTHTYTARHGALNMDEHMWRWESAKKQTTSHHFKQSVSLNCNFNLWKKNAWEKDFKEIMTHHQIVRKKCSIKHNKESNMFLFSHGWGLCS